MKNSAIIEMQNDGLISNETIQEFNDFEKHLESIRDLAHLEEFTDFNDQLKSLKPLKDDKLNEISEVQKEMSTRYVIAGLLVIFAILTFVYDIYILGGILIIIALALVVFQNNKKQTHTLELELGIYNDYQYLVGKKRDLYIDMYLRELESMFGAISKVISLSDNSDYLFLKSINPNLLGKEPFTNGYYTKMAYESITQNKMWDKCENDIYISDNEFHTFLNLSTYSFMQQRIFVFEETSKIFVTGTELEFKDIINFEVYDNSKSIYSGKTTTNTGNAVGRAIVGGVLLGGVGAIIGGATANQTEYGTTTHQHSYSIVISVDSISSPNITINLKSNQAITNELASLLNVVISRNNLSN